ncbi:ActS/PrrB/RegB family redox-sensitive histidine kinase [Brevundimonas sp.]|uniref:ActS/PrrB/RegB family redox-sensitive histidine kinase n=1 Tax=Brevundimonas sp. TaxID=1871086 RepID=UPI003BAD0BBF
MSNNEVEAASQPISIAEEQHRRDLPRRGRGLSLRTLIILRWLAIIGQSATIAVAVLMLHFPLPLWECVLVIAVSVAVNLVSVAQLRRSDSRLPDGRQTAIHLSFDILQLSILLALTGGLENPFCLLLVAPVTVAAASLPGRQAIGLGLLVAMATGVLFFWSLPLPWQSGTELVLPTLYRLGLGLALITGVVFTAAYAWRVAADAEKLELALATTQDVLQREQRLAALGGLAAAAAHELGTPLATIQVVAKELLRSSPPDGPVAEDATLLLQQADRCRDILKRLSQRPEDGDALYTEVGLKALLAEVVDPHLGFDLDIGVSVEGEPEPQVKRLAEVVHGLSAIVENAADFAATQVQVQAMVDEDEITITVTDDGPGFAPDILPRLGEPYVTSRPHGKARLALAAQIRAAARPPKVGSPKPGRGRRKTQEPPVEAIIPSQGGMGLGFFIARTLLERTGGKVSAGPGPDGGARVTVRWPRSALELSPPPQD